MPSDRTPGSARSSPDLQAHAAAVLAGGLPLIDWAAGSDQAIPAAAWVSAIKRAGWPTRRVEVELRNPGRDSAPAVQPVVVVPGSWLLALADRMGVTFRAACRGRVHPDPA